MLCVFLEGSFCRSGDAGMLWEVRRCHSRSTTALPRMGSLSSLSSRCRGPASSHHECLSPATGFRGTVTWKGRGGAEAGQLSLRVRFLHPSPRPILFAPFLFLHTLKDPCTGRQRSCVGRGSFAPVTRSRQYWGICRLDRFPYIKVHFRAASQWKDVLHLRSARCPR